MEIVDSKFFMIKNIIVSGCFKCGTTTIQTIFNIDKTHDSIINIKKYSPEKYNELKIIIFPFRNNEELYKSAFFQDIIVESYVYSPFHKGNFLDKYADIGVNEKINIINNIDVATLVNFYNKINWDSFEHLNSIDRINQTNNFFNINIDYHSNEVQEFIIDNKKLITFNIKILKKKFEEISYSIFGNNDYKYNIYNNGINKWYSKKYTEFLNSFI
jgi:hypothetical protein